MLRTIAVRALMAAVVALTASAAGAQAQPPTPAPQPPHQTLPPTSAPQPPQQTQPPPPAPQQTPPPAQQPPTPAPTGTTGTVTSPPSSGVMSVLPEAAAPVPPCAPPDMSTSIALLDRMQRILDDAKKDDMGKVSIDRNSIDELRAEIGQIRALIVPVKPQ
jgi:hypothetical protein